MEGIDEWEGGGEHEETGFPGKGRTEREDKERDVHIKGTIMGLTISLPGGKFCRIYSIHSYDNKQ